MDITHGIPLSTCSAQEVKKAPEKLESEEPSAAQMKMENDWLDCSKGGREGKNTFNFLLLL